jgi:UDP-N-acetyl-2-amino-2-deoxyglucuronate dehydrogenase
MSAPLNFALIGAAGFVAPRHMRAIRDTGNRLVAATDPHDSVGVLDSYTLDARFFTEIERFDRHLEKLRRKGEGSRVHYVSICSPNYLHDAHCRLALRVRAHAICEKPLVLNPWNLDPLVEIQEETGCRVYTILQLRLHPVLVEFRRTLEATHGSRADVVLTYITRRGAWYHTSWKGLDVTSGGVATNIGIHFFDMLMWLFGRCESMSLHLRDDQRAAGTLELERARVRWFLSVSADDLPEVVRAAGRPAYRSFTHDGAEIEFSSGFDDLHTRQYEEILAGRGFGIEEGRPAIELVSTLRQLPITSPGADAHPLVRRA